MTLHQFLLILRARYRVALLILLLAVSAALAVSLVLPKKYTAQTAVLVDIRSPDPVAGGAPLQGVVAPSYMATQVDIIGGDRVAQRVVKMLKLDEDPAAKARWLEATEGRGTLESWLADSLQKRLDVRPARESNVINITYKGSDPDGAANIANAFAQAYLEINLALKTEPARIYAEWFDAQTKTSRAKLEEAQARLSDYQQKAGIVSTDERVDYETTKLAEISSQLTTVQGETTDSQSKRGARGDTVAEVMQSPLINGLKADVARQEAKVQEVSVRLGENHPERQRAESELAALKSRLGSETARINASIETTYRVGKDRERELQGAVGAQKARVLALNKQRDELNVYRRDVESAQRAYEAVSQSASQTRLQSLTNQTNVVRLNVAMPPVNPSSPRMLVNLLIAAFGGTLLGVACALLLELANRRVRSAEDLVQMLGLPVLASISSSAGVARLSGPRRLALGN
ncbi:MULTISPECIES: chain length determinant protein EpsF [unclassified Polaromonas]|uniref:chain length determinant protein EpsF n=1 Tax=unclassified Polaromonas TaxID=2638319 RepID=UPI000F07C19A|nr:MULTISPECIES: chain length determinant protein EpsF [unclassified Polaromonas]AYQ30197.1 chain length determinant protein EpsF [Polaromonas sp. SP1]QGJ18687.1 chain length determinant protein EpsF [Polaromonas sp. Pch-P]